MVEYNVLFENMYEETSPNYFSPVRRKIKVSNIYPVFLKTHQLINNNIYTPFNLEARQRMERFSDYVDRVNKIITEYTKELFLSKTVKRVVDTCDDSSILEINHDGHNLLTFKTDKHLILLNFNNSLEDMYGKDLIPEEINNREYYIRNFTFEKRNYRIVNTFEAFLNYVHSHSLPENKESNTPFFNSFTNSIANSVFMGNIDRCCKDCGFYATYSGEFRYYIFKDIIIIYDYIAERIPNVSDNELFPF